MLGDAHFIDDWISIDRQGGHHTVLFDENSKLDMFEENTVDCIYSSHMIEHMNDGSVQNIINESYKILKPGGVLRLVAPDAMYYINSYKTLYGRPEAFYIDEYGVGSGRSWMEEVRFGLNLSQDSKDGRLELHNLLCAVFCCYTSQPQYNHIWDVNEVNRRLEDGVDEFIKWASSFYDHSRPGGHINGFYANKVMKMMESSGFPSTFDMKFRESHFEEIVKNDKIDLYLRKNMSFYAEGVK